MQFAAIIAAALLGAVPAFAGQRAWCVGGANPRDVEKGCSDNGIKLVSSSPSSSSSSFRFITTQNLYVFAFFLLQRGKRKLTQFLRFFSKGMREPAARLPPRITGRWPMSASTLEPSLLSMATARGGTISSQLWIMSGIFHEASVEIGDQKGRIAKGWNI